MLTDCRHKAILSLPQHFTLSISEFDLNGHPNHFQLYPAMILGKKIVFKQGELGSKHICCKK